MMMLHRRPSTSLPLLLADRFRRTGGVAVTYSLAPLSTPEPTPSSHTGHSLLDGVNLMAKLHYLLFHRELFSPKRVDELIEETKAVHLKRWRSIISSSFLMQVFGQIDAPVRHMDIIKYFRHHLVHNKTEGSREGAYQTFLETFGDVATGFKNLVLTLVSRDRLLLGWQKEYIEDYLHFSRLSYDDEMIADFLVQRLLKMRVSHMDSLNLESKTMICHQLKIGKLPSHDPDVATVWIEGLDPWMNEDYINYCFINIPEFKNSKVIRNLETHESEGYGALEFSNMAAAERTLHSFNGNWMPLSKRIFNLCLPPPQLGDDCNLDCTVFVGNLAANASEYSLIRIFRCVFNSVVGVKVIRDKLSGNCRGYGFVTFGNEEDTFRALRLTNRFVCLGRWLKIGPARKMSPLDAQQTGNSSMMTGEGGRYGCCQEMLATWFI